MKSNILLAIVALILFDTSVGQAGPILNFIRNRQARRADRFSGNGNPGNPGYQEQESQDDGAYDPGQEGNQGVRGPNSVHDDHEVPIQVPPKSFQQPKKPGEPAFCDPICGPRVPQSPVANPSPDQLNSSAPGGKTWAQVYKEAFDYQDPKNSTVAQIRKNFKVGEIAFIKRACASEANPNKKIPITLMIKATTAATGSPYPSVQIARWSEFHSDTPKNREHFEHMSSPAKETKEGLFTLRTVSDKGGHTIAKYETTLRPFVLRIVETKNGKSTEYFCGRVN